MVSAFSTNLVQHKALSDRLWLWAIEVTVLIRLNYEPEQIHVKQIKTL